MAQLITVYWHDIPAQVIAKVGRTSAKRELPSRFQESIDRAAMVSGEHGTDAYLAAWRRDTAQCGDDLEVEATAAATRIEAEFDDARLAKLVKSGGRAG
ncbi:MAG TPA: virulence factor [Stellaceae bacterium]|nr:virulence factor [Stellaceae bacterium]